MGEKEASFGDGVMIGLVLSTCLCAVLFGIFANGGVPAAKQSSRVQDVIKGCYALGGTTTTEYRIAGVNVSCQIRVEP